MSGRLQGQTAWISGAASGIGEATARLFASEGAAVALIDVDSKLGADLARDIQSAGGRAKFIAADVAREDEVRVSIDETISEFGSLQIIVNCAGIIHVVPLHEYSEPEWDRLMGVNVKGIFFALKHGLVHLKKNGHSYMVNVGSISSFVGQAETPAYTASKGAVLQLSRSIALDYATDGLRCNCLCPGITDTPMLRRHLESSHDPEAALAQRLRRVPAGAALAPVEVARSILYLSCEDSAGVTGTSLNVDGGYLACAEWESDPPTSAD
jgi:NAD(P)-dependent dehydrogenase (short-subunit alcohol dehydrogenase family)